jgi:hypothetical protein
MRLRCMAVAIKRHQGLWAGPGAVEMDARPAVFVIHGVENNRLCVLNVARRPVSMFVTPHGEPWRQLEGSA